MAICKKTYSLISYNMVKTFNILCFFFLLSPFISHSQNSPCELEKAVVPQIQIVDAADIFCTSRASEKNHTIIYTFGIWCGPCKLHLKNAIMLQEKYDVDLYILLIDDNEPEILTRTYDYLTNINQNLKVILLNSNYGRGRNRRYKKFLKEITPPNFENLNGMSKYIVINESATIEMITTWKDNKQYDWTDDINMLNNKVIPLLTPKTLHNK